MPGMNGFEALEQLKGLAETAHIPVLALSAAASQAEIQKGIEAGFAHYLTKPIQVQETVDLIKSVIDSNCRNEPIGVRL